MKKSMKKFVSFLLAAIMVLAVSVPAFAETTTGTITVPETDNHTYAVYQIFTGDLTDGNKLSNIKWGQNGTGIDGEYVDAAVTNEIAATKNSSDTDKLAVINKYAKLDSTAIGTVDKANALEGLAPGYYLIKDSVAVGKGDTETLYIVELVGTVAIARKAGTTTVDKAIVETVGEETTETKVNEASIGDTVDYKLTGTLPEKFENYVTYYYKFEDTLSKGLTYTEDSLKVYVDNNGNQVDVTGYFYKNASEYSATAGTTIEVSIKDLKALNKVDGVTVNKDTKIVVTYSATLNENAVIASTGNPNDVKLIYSNNPNDSGDGPSTDVPSTNPEKPEPDHPTGETPEVEVKTFTTELTILKTDANNKFLPGTEFTLSGNGVNIILVTDDTFDVAADGTYYKLKDGTYTTTAPTVESYIEQTAGDKKVVATDDVKIYTKNGDNYTEVNAVEAYATYYVKQDGNTADYDSTTTKYAKTTTVTQKGKVAETATDVVGVIGDDGTVTFKGLGAGQYTITETKTLPGYNTIAPITFNVTVDKKDEDKLTLTFAADNGITVEDDNTLATTIINYTGNTLPTTGGIGTTLFYVAGAILAIGAGVLLVTKRRMAR